MDVRASTARLLADLDQVSPAGFAIALHIVYTRPTFLFQTYPRRWIEHYDKNSLVIRDPTVLWGFKHTGWVHWSSLEAQDDAGVLEQAKDFGIMTGTTVAVSDKGSRTIASFARADRDFEETECKRIEDLLGALHDTTLDAKDALHPDHDALVKMSHGLTHN